jgi:hypothetical protein
MLIHLHIADTASKFPATLEPLTVMEGVETDLLVCKSLDCVDNDRLTPATTRDG